MFINRKLILIFEIFILCISLTACWNYREIDEMTIIQGLAVDKQDDNYLITVESITPKGGKEIEMVSDVMSQKGKTIFDAIRNMIRVGGKRLYWSHAKVIVVSEEIAKEGLVPILDYITRDAEVRENMWLIVSKEKSAKKLFEGKDYIHDSLSSHLEDMLEAEGSIETYYGVELWKFLKDLSDEGISPVLPVAKLFQQPDELTPDLFGIGAFKKDKLVGILTGNEVKSFLLIRDELEGGLFIIQNVANTGTDISLEIFKSKTKVKPTIIDDKLIMDIDIETDVGIGELTKNEDFISEDGRNRLKKETEKHIKENVQQTIEKVTKEFKSDIFGFGLIIKLENPELWKELEPNWDQYFTSIDANIHVKIDIRGSALTSAPIKVGE